MKHKIFFFTFSRSDYSSIRTIIKKNISTRIVSHKLVVGGSHLIKNFGHTIKEIQEDNIDIDFKINFLKDNQKYVEKNTNILFSNLIKIFSRFLIRNKVQNIFIVGDRWELVPLVISAFNNNLTIYHHSGGDYTLGSKDNFYRNIISLLSNFHLAANYIHKKRLELLGISNKKIYVVGEPSLSNIEKKKYNKKEYILATLYPSDYEKKNYLLQIKIFLNFLSSTKKKIILTMPANEKGSKIFLREIKKIKNRNFNIYYNLGTLKYNKFMSQAKMMVGNSSSGIIEASSYGLPVINIGNRQGGRLKPRNVIDVDFNLKKIKHAYIAASKKKFRQNLKNIKNPYFQKNCELKILNIFNKNCNRKKENQNYLIDTYKKFYEFAKF